MKRALALLLSMTMLMSMSACSRKKEDHDTKLTKVSTKSETTTEPETETSLTETETETETSESTEETSGTTAIEKESYEPVPVTLTHDLENIKISFDSIYHAYAQASPDPNSHADRIQSRCTILNVESSGYDELKKIIESENNIQKAETDALFEENVRVFPDVVKNLDKYDFYGRDQNISYSRDIVRADSLVTSIYQSKWYRFSDNKTMDEYTCTCYDSKTGKPISLDDLITDKNAFADVVEKYANGHNEDYSAFVNSLASDIRSGNYAFSFLLYQNCICFIKTFTEDDYTWTDRLYVSALGLDNCLDTKYFTSSPKNYTLYPDSNEIIRWDFDGDGILDELAFINTSDWDSAPTAMLNDEPLDLPSATNELSNNDGVASFYMIQINGTFYLYVSCYTEDPTLNSPVFRFSNGKFEYTGCIAEFDSYPYDPDSCFLGSRCDMLGTGSYVRQIRLSETDGLPKPTDAYCRKTGLGITKKELVVDACGQNRKPTGKKITIPAGTPVAVSGFDVDKELVYLTTLNIDRSKNEEFTMALTVDPEWDNYNLTYNGENGYELFEGCFYFD